MDEMDLIRELTKQRKEIAELKEEIADLKWENERLNQIIDRLPESGDPAE